MSTEYELYKKNNEDVSIKYGGKSSALPAFSAPAKALVCILAGMLFGFAMQRGSVTDPGVIQNQMVFKQFTMLKFFLSALSTSMFAMSILSMLPQTHEAFYTVSIEYFNKILGHTIRSSIVGGVLMGAGMNLAGSCPTSVFLQVGAMVPNSGCTFLGALTAVFMFILFKPKLDAWFLTPTTTSTSNTKIKNPWHKSPYFPLSLPLAAMFGVLVCAFETLVPFHIDSNLPVTKASSLSTYPWPPYLCGILVGIVQIPLILIIHKTLSGSSCIVVLESQLFVGPLKGLSSYAGKFQNLSFDTWWQVIYVGGAVLGSLLSANQSGTLEMGRVINPGQAFLGGFVMHMGARIAGGCTSGHGITGISLLSILSFITITSTFASGIGLGFVFKFLNM